MRPVLIGGAVLVAVAAVIAAVLFLTGDDDSPVDQDVAEEEPAVAPLTGEEIDDREILERPAVAIKVDNAPQARPPLGLEDADIVFTELVEGGTTRFIALYHSQLPDSVGPVRSGRDVDAQILPPFSAVFAISGAAGPTYEQLRGADLLVFEEGQADAFRREGSRTSPHNLFVSPEALVAAAEDLPPAEQPWPFDAEGPGGGEEAAGDEEAGTGEEAETGEETAPGEEASSARLTYSPSYSAEWSWDASAGRWLRSQDGETHTDADGGQLDAATVVVARVTTFEGGGTDAGGNPIPVIETIGEGDALVLRDGRSFPARWRKSSAQSHFEWLTPDGEPLPLHPGRTWVELVPEQGSVDVAGGAGEG